MYVLYRDLGKRSLAIAGVPQGVTGEQFVKGISGAVHISNHATREEAEEAKRVEQNPHGDAAGKGDRL